MAKNQIRLQYSGFIIFISKMLSVATGFAFQLMIARVAAKSASEYGIWFNMSDLLNYFILLSGVLPFWTMRFTARSKEGAVKTGLIANLIISFIATAIYVPLVPFLTSALNIPQNYVYLYFVISAQIIELYTVNMLSACIRAKRPQCLGYGLLIEEAARVFLAYILIIQLNQLLLGALLSLITAYAVQIFYYIKIVGEELKQKIKWNYMKEWLKGSIANIYNIIGNQVANFILIILFIYGGNASRGYYGAASIIANIIPYSFFLAFALYPKLLAERKTEDITTALKMVLMFAIPMAAGAIAIPDSFVTILKSEYSKSATILSILAIDGLTITLTQFFTSVIFGFERLDEKAEIPLKQLIKSNIFKVFTLPYLRSLITLPTAFYVLTVFAFKQPLTAAVYVAIITMSARLIIFTILCVIVRKTVQVIVPWRNIAKYAFAAAIMGITLHEIPHPTRITTTIGVTIAGGILYAAVLLIIDKEARKLLKDIITELRKEIKGLLGSAGKKMKK
ncbi:hypothetical protein J7L49_00400 [Candidatus Bathyarchaeota archaeon]|nr:hypothetical protein [Candidatus Bathyarchaeota archaeon]